jgi:hypothetical protein
MRRLNVTQEDVVCPTITFINKGKVKSKDVRVVKENGVPVKLTNLSAKTFYGASTGYISEDRKTITAPNGSVVATNVSGLEDI